MERDYEALADAAERGELQPDPKSIKRGAEATAEDHDYSRDLMVGIETGSSSGGSQLIPVPVISV